MVFIVSLSLRGPFGLSLYCSVFFVFFRLFLLFFVFFCFGVSRCVFALFRRVVFGCVSRLLLPLYMSSVAGCRGVSVSVRDTARMSLWRVVFGCVSRLLNIGRVSCRAVCIFKRARVCIWAGVCPCQRVGYSNKCSIRPLEQVFRTSFRVSFWPLFCQNFQPNPDRIFEPNPEFFEPNPDRIGSLVFDRIF
jgi:hypothetical protein